MIIACYNIYNEAKYLEESMKSIRDKVDKIVVIDGAYRKFPHIIPFSTDDSLKIAEKYADKVIKCEREMVIDNLESFSWESEIAKRNQYLIGEEGDIYLVVDGHEIWKGALPNPPGDYRLVIKKDGKWLRFPRMFRHREGIFYMNHHYELWDANGKINDEFPEYPLVKGYFDHKDDCEKERAEARKIYYSLPNFDQ